MSKVVGIFVKFFTMSAHQIWSYHVTQEANFVFFFYFVLILHLILGKVTKFVVEKLSTSDVICQKPHGGWKTPPPLSSAFKVKNVQVHTLCGKSQCMRQY